MNEYKKSFSNRQLLIMNSCNPELLERCLELLDQDKLVELMELIGNHHKDSPWKEIN